MARSYVCFVLVLALAAVHTCARDVPTEKNMDVASTKNAPSDAGLTDQKNFVTYGGVGGYSGIGAGGLPFGGVGGIGGVAPLDGGFGGLGGGGGLGGLGGGVGGGVGAGGGVGGGVGGGSGVLPYP
ncbi:acanthoscurrin-2-like isoform X1 [Populus alba x Populus x berolinensis]|nr:acanthoscurrin-2-like isoform X1 [Populus alba x Populus x berolinensis]